MGWKRVNFFFHFLCIFVLFEQVYWFTIEYLLSKRKNKFLIQERLNYSNQCTHRVIWMMRYWENIVINKFILNEFNKGNKCFINFKNISSREIFIHDQSQAQRALPGETWNPRHHASPTSFSVYLIILHFIVLRILII